MLRPLLAVGLASVVSLLACGGAVAREESASSSSSGSTTSSGGTSGIGGSSGISSSGDPDCAMTDVAVDRVCVPGVAPAGLAITIDVDSNTCRNCGSTVAPCEATVNGSSITLSVQEVNCSSPTGNCTCQLVEETCVIPPLAAGTYDVRIAGSVEIKGIQTLFVAESGTSSACTLPLPGASPPPLDPTKYSTTCMADSDCATVLTGDLCAPCGCPSTVIALSDKDRYDADARATRSQCEPAGLVPTSCTLCAVTTPHCLLPADSSVGTCVGGT